ncbi:MAG: undecaprenyl-phosphate glucose phosphotransferase [Proteobacteria bacterium]|nr:undecaprenyl-phosphate glucose phosphotransferase [Pseudomonadota bacterium]
MLYRYSEVFRTLLMVADLVLVACAWLAAYGIRFHTDLPVPRGIPSLQPYATALVVILPTWFWLFRSHGLYQPRRTGSLLGEAGSLLRATAIGVVVLVAMAFFYRSFSYSRGVVMIFSVLSPVMVLGLRIALRVGLRRLRRRGYNLRYIVVVGGGQLAEETIERVHAHPEAGLRVRGVFTDRLVGARERVRGVPVLGTYGELKEYLGRTRVDQVIIALPWEENVRLDKLLADLDDEIVTVKMIPDVRNALSLRRTVEDLDGLPVINLREGPMVGWAAVQKRLFDLSICVPALVVAAPIMALVGLAVWATSGRPIFYTQERVGLDGRVFRMHKFRSMTRDAEADTGPLWARADDPRRTRLGAWLRRFGIDELPQLWNVLRGDMSLVGPRPERPVFIESFRHEIPGYMLRHHVKAGLTGWAQIHGWRGNTSLHERLEHDVYYIQNWSLGLDVRILLMTLWRSLRNAY